MPNFPDLVWGIHGLPKPEAEYRFHPERKWRFDYAWPNHFLIAVEIEGAIWTGGRHTRGSGFAKDMEKYNAAGKLGWRVFRFTPTELRKGIAQSFMKEVFNGSHP
jgi:hypothetical protein